ncbi:Quino protein alcohol dehydrogenase-like protein [Microthyrium microscopicum]|uniref:Quino protein alcohol dehydrogenase-like protein n=1 Tax=Microthyrium microscopicum TaxID=703497 RepID=A0A6A6UGB5_9PEZI|nr:Quino protein alcohol dehydrogenase-like protein [Microthyrium microscopicum]
MAILNFLFSSAFLYINLLRPVSAVDTTLAPAHPPNEGQWSGWGGNIYNNRWARTNTQINSSSIDQIVENCRLDYPLGVSATTVVLNNTAFYPTANGSFYALNIGTCEYVWQINVAKIIYDFAIPNAEQQKNALPMSRTSPQIDGDVLYFGTQCHALLVAVDLYSGELLATTQVNSHDLAIVTMSPTVYNGSIFVGTSSQEESATLDPNFVCCNYIGNFASYKFDRTKKAFTRNWNFNTLPVNQGWAGAGVWGAQPSIDPVRNQVFVGTGNTYIYPAEYEKCVNSTADCMPDDVSQESILAFDIPTGKLNWKFRQSPLDNWVISCGTASAPVSNNQTLCPGRPGPDADFAMAPTFVPAALGDGTTGVDSVVVGQKSGDLFNLNAITGAVTWQTNTAQAQNVGGMSFGIAVDDASIYFTGINYGTLNWTLKTSGATINNSAFGSANLKTGAFQWMTPVPENQLAYSPPGLVNDIILVSQSGSRTQKVIGNLLALSKTTGAILKKIPLNSVQHGGIMADGGFVMFGTGYQFVNAFTTGSFYVMGLPDAIAAAKKAPAFTRPPAPPGASSTSTGTKASQTSQSAKKNTGTRTAGDLILTTAIFPMALCAGLMVCFG